MSVYPSLLSEIDLARGHRKFYAIKKNLMIIRLKNEKSSTEKKLFQEQLLAFYERKELEYMEYITKLQII